MKKTLFLFSFLALCAQARMIQWFAEPHSVNLTEDGGKLDRTFRFELGVFENFTPTAENMDQWSEHWVAAQRVTYHEENQWFTSVLRVTDNAAPFTVGARAYVWGFSGGPDEGEWILFRAANWSWPRANPNHPNAVTWDTRAATEVIMGSIGNGGELIRTARVHGKVPPITTWLQWLADNNETAETGSVMEYATGSPYAALGMVRNADGSFELIVPRRADRPGNFHIEVTEDLSDPDWRPAGELTELVRQDHTRLVFGKGPLRDIEPGQLFFRFKVSLDE